MLRTNPRQISFYSVLYHNIPKNHILKLINSAISLNFVNNALKDSTVLTSVDPQKSLK